MMVKLNKKIFLLVLSLILVISGLTWYRVSKKPQTTQVSNQSNQTKFIAISVKYKANQPTIQDIYGLTEDYREEDEEDIYDYKYQILDQNNAVLSSIYDLVPRQSTRVILMSYTGEPKTLRVIDQEDKTIIEQDIPNPLPIKKEVEYNDTSQISYPLDAIQEEKMLRVFQQQLSLSQKRATDWDPKSQLVGIGIKWEKPISPATTIATFSYISPNHPSDYWNIAFYDIKKYQFKSNTQITQKEQSSIPADTIPVPQQYWKMHYLEVLKKSFEEIPHTSAHNYNPKTTMLFLSARKNRYLTWDVWLQDKDQKNIATFSWDANKKELLEKK